MKPVIQQMPRQQHKEICSESKTGEIKTEGSCMIKKRLKDKIYVLNISYHQKVLLNKLAVPRVMKQNHLMIKSVPLVKATVISLNFFNPLITLLCISQRLQTDP